MSDPRRRKDRHALTPDNLSSAIQLTNMPADWTQDTASSVVAGSGPIVEISTKTDPRTGRMSAAIFEYKTSKDCKRAYEILGRIENLPCSLERIIPQSYKLGATVAKEELQLNRETFPWNCGLDLPFEMISEVPLPRKPSQTPAPPLNNSNNNANNVSKSNNNIAFPDILRKASQHLPQLQPNVLLGTDPVSMNLSKIPPLQLIEIISNLKILANQDSTKRNQLESFLKTNLNISISVTQALLEMGFINYNVVTQVLKQRQGGNGFGSAVNSSSNTPVNHNIPMPVPMPIPPPFVAPQQQQQQQQQQAPPAPFGFVPPPMPFMPPTPAIGTPPPPMMTMPQLAPQTQQPPQTGINLGKLQALPQNQRDMIKQVLKFTDEQVRMLPPDQKTLVENLKKEYIL